MNKSVLCQLLIDDIKDEVEFDSDVSALKTLLLILLDYSEKNSFENWKYIILKYDILSREIDFLPLIKDYPEKLIEKVGISNFFMYMQDIPDSKLKIIYRFVFNIYNSECIVYQSLKNYIVTKNEKEESKLIENILNKSSLFSEFVFDKFEFIKRIVILHIDNKYISIDFLKKLIDKVNNKKDQAVLKTLLIDYLVY